MRRDAAWTIVAVGVAVLALDDITTDNALRFPLERTALALCAVWFGFLAWRLALEHNWIVAGVSITMIGLGAWVHPALSRGIEPSRFEYLVTVGALVWFLAVALYLLKIPQHRVKPRSRLS